MITLALGLASFPAISAAQGMNSSNMAARLDQVVTLTADQKVQVTEIFTEENTALQAIPAEDRVEKGMPIRQAARAQVRALLTPEQQRIYDQTPQTQGGGQTVNPANMAARMDKVVTLTDDQVAKVAQISEQEAEALNAIPLEDRTEKGMAIRQAAKAQLRALLTPEQQRKFDANPGGAEDLEVRAYVVSFLESSPIIAARVGVVTRVSSVGLYSVVVSTDRDLSLKGTYSYEVVGSMRVRKR